MSKLSFNKPIIIFDSKLAIVTYRFGLEKYVNLSYEDGRAGVFGGGGGRGGGAVQLFIHFFILFFTPIILIQPTR